LPSGDALWVHETEDSGASEGSPVEPWSRADQWHAVGAESHAHIGDGIGRAVDHPFGSRCARILRTLDRKDEWRHRELDLGGINDLRAARASPERAGWNPHAARLAPDPERTGAPGGHVRRIVTNLVSFRSFSALGTTATVVTADEWALDSAADEVHRELADIDRTCSRFRDDSDLEKVNAAAGTWVRVDLLLIEAVEVALRAAHITGGLVDPTIGTPMRDVGYDRDFTEVIEGGRARIPSWIAAPGWDLVEVRRDLASIRVAPGVRIDLGSTAKALAADRSSIRASVATGTGVLVGLGGDIAVAGPPPTDGWPVGIAEDHAGEPAPGETISIFSGGVATSSTTVRRWTQGGTSVHHILDPRSGRPANGIWRAVSVCAASCVDANIASTASIVAGERDPGWLERQGLPARLVRQDGTILRLGGWPEAAVR
jgi:thiamine biosynthesis lipoprotein